MQSKLIPRLQFSWLCSFYNDMDYPSNHTTQAYGNKIRQILCRYCVVYNNLVYYSYCNNSASHLRRKLWKRFRPCWLAAAALGSLSESTRSGRGGSGATPDSGASRQLPVCRDTGSLPCPLFLCTDFRFRTLSLRGLLNFDWDGVSSGVPRAHARVFIAGRTSFVRKKVRTCKKFCVVWVPSVANPTIADYNASVVNFYNATGSLARFENKNILFYF
jgi:hypothetical protein